MDHFAYQNGALHAEDVSLAAIAAEVGTPFYCYSTATLTRHFQVFDRAMAGYDHKICFAVKANGNPAVLRVLGALGAGADVVSQGEIRLARLGGIAARNIVFSGVAKTREEMAYGLSEGIFQFNAESLWELGALNEVAASLGTQAPVALRVNPDVDAATHEKISTGQKENKFGIAMEQVREAYLQAASLPHLRVQGVSMHIGSQIGSLEPFRRAFRVMLALVTELRAEGHCIDTLDLGGGLGIPYGTESTPPEPQAYASAVREEIGAFDGRLLFEPGRMIAGNAGVLVTRVIGLKQSPHRRFVMVDAGMNDLMRPALYGAHHEVVPVAQPEARSQKSEVCDLVGPVCESSDVFARDYPLPAVHEGDLLALRSCGAYGASMSNSYNARLLVPEVLTEGKSWRLIRRRPSYEEMAQLFIKP